MDYTDLGREIHPERYPLFLMMLSKGLAALYEYARCESGFIPDPKGYVSKCDLCYAIRSWISKTTGSPDLGPEEFYRLQ